MTAPLTCTRCDKRLTRKTARQIDGKPVCSACLFANRAKPGFLRNRVTTGEIR